MDIKLICACCGAPLDPRDAAPGAPSERWKYHADLARCWRELQIREGYRSAERDDATTAALRGRVGE